jgi:hypothetical protein
MSVLASPARSDALCCVLVRTRMCVAAVAAVASMAPSTTAVAADCECFCAYEAAVAKDATCPSRLGVVLVIDTSLLSP